MHPQVLVLDEHAVNIFTDGSSLPSPRRGGIGIRIVVVGDDGHEEYSDHPLAGRAGGTNQEMELLACVEALRLVGGRHSPVDLARYSKVVVITDSQYVANNYKLALYEWPTTGWYGRDDTPIVNAALWKDLVAATFKVDKRVEFRWFKGHSAANPHNKAVDKMAKASAKGVLESTMSISRVRRKKTTKATEVGSIPPEAQRITLRVVTDRWLNVQKTFMYKCEVMSEDSPYQGNMDNLFSDIMLSAGHIYEVRMSNDGPYIDHLYGEIEVPSGPDPMPHASLEEEDPSP